MNLEQVCRKYGISNAFLNAKDDGLKVAVKSIQDLVKEMQAKNVDKEVTNKVMKLGEFLNDVSNSTIG